MLLRLVRSRAAVTLALALGACGKVSSPQPRPLVDAPDAPAPTASLHVDTIASAADAAPVASTASAAANAPAEGETSLGEPGADYLRHGPFTMLMHADTPYRLMQGKSIDRESDVHLSVPRIRRGGVGAFSAVLFVEGRYQRKGAADYCARATSKIGQVIEQHADLLAAGRSADDFVRNWRAGRTTVLRAIEGSWCLGGRVEAIDEQYALGVRMIGLTWEGDHEFATSWADSSGKGLTELGRRAVERMNQVGIIVDVSHMSNASVNDVLSIARAPVFASHSNARALATVPRNLNDDHLRRIAQSGGIIGLNLYPPHLRAKGNATVADAVAQIRYLRDLVGIQAIGLGSDFDGIAQGPAGLETAGELPNLRAALAESGFSADDIAAVFGGNFLRALRNVELQAIKLSGSGSIRQPAATSPSASSPIPAHQ